MIRKAKNTYGRIRLAARMMKDGFKRQGEPCPYCKRPGAWLGRKEERICLNCTYGWLWPETREHYGWDDPIVVEFEGRYQP